MKVTHVFVKERHGSTIRSRSSLLCSGRGIAGNVACAPFRQALMTSHSVTTELGLQPGDLRENIVLEFDNLYELPSGTVVRIGEVLIRLTFHCEPCKKIVGLVDLERVLHRRGVFGTFLNSGEIAVGHRLVVTDQKLESIPYAIGERIRWFLKRHGPAAAAMDLVHEIGLPASSSKVLPRLLGKFMAF